MSPIKVVLLSILSEFKSMTIIGRSEIVEWIGANWNVMKELTFVDLAKRLMRTFEIRHCGKVQIDKQTGVRRASRGLCKKREKSRKNEKTDRARAQIGRLMMVIEGDSSVQKLPRLRRRWRRRRQQQQRGQRQRLRHHGRHHGNTTSTSSTSIQRLKTTLCAGALV